MDSGANLMQTFTDFSEWKTELAKNGIIGELNDNGNWYKVEEL
jgi:hypothetical protein